MTLQYLLSDHGNDRANNASESSTCNEEVLSSSPGLGIGVAVSENRPSKSTNPYRQLHSCRGELHPNALFQQAEHLVTPTRKKAPTKAVFNDLTTAHSLITSGSARNELRTTSTNEESEVYVDDEDSIPLQDLSPADD